VHRVLITGAAGSVGSILRDGLGGRFPVLRLLDIVGLGACQPGEELLQVDIGDLAAVTQAMASVDATVHLAGIPHEDTFERILAANLVGTDHVMEAARLQGCRRLVLASSNHVTGLYPAGQRLDPEMPTRPDSLYGVSKTFEEQLGRLDADKHGLEVVCVRIGTVADRPTTPRQLRTWLSPRDTVELFSRCLVAPEVGFTTLYGASANERGWWDLRSAERLGYRPADNAERWAAQLQAAPTDPAASADGPQGGGLAHA